MSVVISEFKIHKYVVLKLDKMPKTKYTKYRIGNIEFAPVPVYDMPSCIAIESNESFIGKTVEFV